MENKTEVVEVVEFNAFNIMAGKFGSKKAGKQSAFKMFASLRLTLESGFTLSDKQTDIMSNMSYKWNYYIKNNEETTGTIIVSLHKKDINVWSYAVIDEAGEITCFNTITDAKNSLK